MYKVVGLQRSGTNFLSRVIDANCDLKESQSTWKHSMHECDTRVKNVMVTKHPYNWCKSIVTRERQDLLWTYRHYNLRAAGDDMWRDINLQNLMNLYNDWHNEWLPRAMHVRYEDLLVDPMRALKPLRFVKLPPSMNIDTYDFFLPEDRRKDYIDVKINRVVSDQLNKYIDRKLIDRLGYKLVK